MNTIMRTMNFIMPWCVPDLHLVLHILEVCFSQFWRIILHNYYLSVSPFQDGGQSARRSWSSFLGHFLHSFLWLFGELKTKAYAERCSPPHLGRASYARPPGQVHVMGEQRYHSHITGTLSLATLSPRKPDHNWQPACYDVMPCAILDYSEINCTPDSTCMWCKSEWLSSVVKGQQRDMCLLQQPLITSH